MAPVISALRRRGVEASVIHTGQHDELAWPLYRHFGITPGIELQRSPEDRTLAGLSAGLLRALDGVMAEHPPRAVLVHGDTTTAAMAALSAFYRNVPVAHVEAGLRSHRLNDPFPEEFNRSMIARIAQWHFAPTEHAVRNLYSEGVDPERTFLVGNTVIDAAHAALRRMNRSAQHASTETAEQRSAIDTMATATSDHRLVLVTLHRREQWGEPLNAIARAVFALVQAHPDLEVLWPLHANPELAQQIRDQASTTSPQVRSRCHLVAPLDYPELIEVLARAWMVITDSGGLQEEACALNVPVLVTRDSTERPELIETGAGRLVGTDPIDLIRAFEGLWRDPSRHQAMRAAHNPFGDGRASERIATVLGEWLGQSENPSVPAYGVQSMRIEVAPRASRRDRAPALLRPLKAQMRAPDPTETRSGTGWAAYPDPGQEARASPRPPSPGLNAS
jgi:UDP-N-acetylglucosamine 2-epimerase